MKVLVKVGDEALEGQVDPPREGFKWGTGTVGCTPRDGTGAEAWAKLTKEAGKHCAPPAQVNLIVGM